MKPWMLDKSDDLHRYNVKAIGHCEICGETNRELLEDHHIYFGSKKSILEIRLNPKLACCLCNLCHHHRPYAPHKDNKLFFAMLEAKLIQSDPKRMKYINVIRNTPDSELGGKVELRCIYLDLQNQAKHIEKTSWYDSDLEPEWRGRKQE